MPLSTQVYKWVSANLMLGGGGGGGGAAGNPAINYYPTRGRKKHTKSLNAIETCISAAVWAANVHNAVKVAVACQTRLNECLSKDISNISTVS